MRRHPYVVADRPQSGPVQLDGSVDAVIHAPEWIQRIEAEARRNGQNWGDVKSGRGSLRDIEFVVQFLQLHYGTIQL